MWLKIERGIIIIKKKKHTHIERLNGSGDLEVAGGELVFCNQVSACGLCGWPLPHCHFLQISELQISRSAHAFYMVCEHRSRVWGKGKKIYSPWGVGFREVLFLGWLVLCLCACLFGTCFPPEDSFISSRWWCWGCVTVGWWWYSFSGVCLILLTQLIRMCVRP